MKIIDLINLETQISNDAEEAYDSLLRRDRTLLSTAEAAQLSRSALLQEWIQRLNRASQETPFGSHVVRGYRFATWLLVVVGAIAGTGAASLVLNYDGTHPINVLYFLFVFVVLQLLASAGSVLVVLWRSLMLGRNNSLAWGSDVLGAVRFLNQWVARRVGRVSSERVQSWRNAWIRLRRQSKPYRSTEFWWLFTQAHWFGVALNVAAIATLLYSVFFSDLAFAWSTTLDVESTEFATWVQRLAAPWSVLWTEALPTEAMVSATRYSRLTGSYLAGKRELTDPLVVGGWWAFLLCASATYGLLPRLLLLTFSRFQFSRTLRNLPLNTPDMDRVVARLRAPVVETRGESTSPGLVQQQSDATPLHAGDGVGKVHLLFWRDAPVSALRRVSSHFSARYQWTSSGYEELHPTAVRSSPKWGGVSTALVLVAEGWEAPDKGFRRTLTELRQEAGTERSIFVALLGAEGPILQTWVRTLQGLQDPYLAVEQVP